MMDQSDFSQSIGQVPVCWTGDVPVLFADADGRTWRRVIEFFTACIRNPNTRAAYAHAVRQFCAFCDEHGIGLAQVRAYHVAAHIEQLQQRFAPPSVKQHLAALRMLFDYLVVGQILAANPATAVRGPKHVVSKGLTPVLAPEEAHALFEAIDVSTISGLRDRALLGVMVYSFARVGAVVAMNTEDYFCQGKRFWFRLHEKGGRLHDVPAHHKAEEFMDAYLAVGNSGPKGTPLFRTIDRQQWLTNRRIDRADVLAMVKRRTRQAGLQTATCCHSFRATGITCYLLNGGRLEHAQRIAAHASPRTTKLYDRTSDQISLDEIEKIAF